MRETVREITIPKYIEVERSPRIRPKLFAEISNEQLLSYGIPEEWLADVRVANEDTVLELADHLPGEAAEALLDLATGTTPKIPQAVMAGEDPFAHPDAQRRFRVMNNVDELQRALDYPWDKWTVFLHPQQQQLVERDYNGPARVSGSAGTGKTIVALHRAVFLARQNPDARVLLTTFSDALANALRVKLKRLISHEPRLAERLEVHAMNALGRRLYEYHLGALQIASPADIQALLQQANQASEAHKFSQQFLLNEWQDVVDAWQVDHWEAYRDVKRLGRKTRLSEPKRQLLWHIFAQVRVGLRQRQLITYADLFSQLAAQIATSQYPPFDYAVVDEAQDVSVAQLRFLAALGADRPNSLFFSGDLGQRIFQQPFSWKALDVDVRGRARTLKINYRTSHQIRQQADQLLDPQLSDVDGNTEARNQTISVFNGSKPRVARYDHQEAEISAISQWLAALIKDGLLAHEIGVFVRSESELARARAVMEKIDFPYKLLDEQFETVSGHVIISTMHLAKGLEFKAVVVMACDDEVIPLQSRIETVADHADLEDVYNTERHLLYVACTRARDHLLVTGVEPCSEFLDDLHMGD